MPIPLVDLKAQYQAIKPEIDAAIARVIGHSGFILGEEVRRFEADFAAFCDLPATAAVGVDSGTAALHLALLACGIGAGDEVIVPSHTFIATASNISHLGARPVFVDIDLDTYNVDPAKIEAAITPRTRAIIPVHLYGQPADMAPILDIARRHGLRVIEDAAQAHGATYRGQKVGGLGDVGIFSFYPGKNLGAYGDAGMLVSRDPQIADTARLLRDHGRRDKYEHLIEGYNYRLDALQAAILGAKLPHLAAWNEQRRRHAAAYNDALADLELVRPIEALDRTHVYHLYVVRVEHRDELLQHLRAKGIGAGVHYPIPLHLQPAYRHLGYRSGDLPATERAANEVLSLPMYPELTPAQIEEVAEAIRDFEKA
jgi:dTDP-4-amino-4,6-dideoxygalactose transaminase